METILIVDDDSDVRETTKSLLEEEYAIITACSGADGLYMLGNKNISLVILDYSLPDMNGLDILRKIKEDHGIPVIMITGLGDKEVVLKSWRHKADYYFDKPFKMLEFKEKVTELLNPPDKQSVYEALNLDPSSLSSNMQNALEFIGRHLSCASHEKLTLKKISAVTAVTPKYLSMLFRKECGMTICRIITTLKIENARKLLGEGKDVKGVAFDLGYGHPNNFCRFIKKNTGKPPSGLLASE